LTPEFDTAMAIPQLMKKFHDAGKKHETTAGIFMRSILKLTLDAIIMDQEEKSYTISLLGKDYMIQTKIQTLDSKTLQGNNELSLTLSINDNHAPPIRLIPKDELKLAQKGSVHARENAIARLHIQEAIMTLLVPFDRSRKY